MPRKIKLKRATPRHTTDYISVIKLLKNSDKEKTLKQSELNDSSHTEEHR